MNTMFNKACAKAKTLGMEITKNQFSKYTRGGYILRYPTGQGNCQELIFFHSLNQLDKTIELANLGIKMTQESLERMRLLEEVKS